MKRVPYSLGDAGLKWLQRPESNRRRKAYETLLNPILRCNESGASVGIAADMPRYKGGLGAYRRHTRVSTGCRSFGSVC
jgi:hypothetical protein